MGKINVAILDPARTRKQKAELPDHVPAYWIMAECLTKWGLPPPRFNTDYKFSHKGKLIGDEETLAQAGVKNGSELKVTLQVEFRDGFGFGRSWYCGVNGSPIYVVCTSEVYKKIDAICTFRKESIGVLIGSCAIDVNLLERYPVSWLFISEAREVPLLSLWKHYRNKELRRIKANLNHNDIVLGWFVVRCGKDAMLSQQDIDEHRRWFREPWHIALLVDSKQDIAAFFAGIEPYSLSQHSKSTVEYYKSFKNNWRGFVWSSVPRYIYEDLTIIIHPDVPLTEPHRFVSYGHRIETSPVPLKDELLTPTFNIQEQGIIMKEEKLPEESEKQIRLLEEALRNLQEMLKKDIEFPPPPKDLDNPEEDLGSIEEELDGLEEYSVGIEEEDEILIPSYLRITIIDNIEQKEQKAELPADVPIGRIIPALITKMGLPSIIPQSGGAPILYRCIHKGTGMILDGNQTLVEAGVKNGDILMLYPDILV